MKAAGRPPASADEANRMLREAEALHARQRPADAAGLVAAVLRIAPGHAQLHHFHAVLLRAARDLAGAHAAARRACELAPNVGAFADLLGTVLGELGRHDEAVLAHERAVALAPELTEARLNRALALQDAGRLDEARRALVALGTAEAARARAALELDAGDLDAAALALDQALARDPADRKARHGRAKVAADRGEPDAAERLRAALAAAPDDPELLVDALHLLDGDEAARLVERRLAETPDWHEGRRALALQRRERGDPQWLDAHRAIVASRPVEPRGWREMVDLLTRADAFRDAADQCRRAAAVTGRIEFLAGAVALHDAAGEISEADALLTRPEVAALVPPLAKAKHALVRGRPEQAEATLAERVAATPDDVEAWALRGVAWHLLGDDRATWLNGQPGLVAMRPVPLSDRERAEAVAVLDALHARAAERLGQSVRGGTQTGGNLFDRLDPAIRRLRDALTAAVEDYRAGLPPRDPAHPALRHRDAPWRMPASWSVRLSAGGRHVSHIHPKGVFSSASYWRLEMTAGGDPEAGWLELGRPPDYLGLAVEPIATVEPRIGWLALFPSTLHHGTRPFAGGERMTVAFDIAPRPTTRG